MSCVLTLIHALCVNSCCFHAQALIHIKISAQGPSGPVASLEYSGPAAAAPPTTSQGHDIGESGMYVRGRTLGTSQSVYVCVCVCMRVCIIWRCMHYMMQFVNLY